MIETVVIKYLKSALGVSVTAETPKTETEYITVQKIDGGRRNHVDMATLSIKCISTTLNKTAKLDERLRDAMHDLITQEDISRVELGGNGSDINTATKTYAYESIWNIYYFE